MDSFECPSCGQTNIQFFYQVKNVPVHSVQIIRERNVARNFPVGNIDLGLCDHCGFVSNYSYKPELQDYSFEYESTQTFSGTYNKFAIGLVEKLVNQYGLRNKTVIEIGCGQGELLNLIAREGNNNCLGFDPAFENEIALDSSVKIVKDYFSGKYSNSIADAVVCKMTLEHIQKVKEFIDHIRLIFKTSEQLLFIQVPNAGKVFSDGAFWDIYYEHCSYFTKQSLVNLIRQAGFTVVSAEFGFEDQYLMIVGRLAIEPYHDHIHYVSEPLSSNSHIDYGNKIAELKNHWTEFFARKPKTKTGVLWGGGSKAVAFLTTLGLSNEISCVVDVNPRKENTYLPVTGHQVVTPLTLKKANPDYVIVMNPIYVPEIKNKLHELGLSPSIFTVEK
jgi:2-polyprenyl-3-methyl-5-hydroxy-6-metoxy-1,4-benzoquinol methylase